MPIYFYNQWYDVLNNFSANAVEIDGILYPTSEHAYQAAKCTDPNGKEEVRMAKSPLLAKEISNRKYKLAKDPDWDAKSLQLWSRFCAPNSSNTEKFVKRYWRVTMKRSPKTHLLIIFGAEGKTATEKIN